MQKNLYVGMVKPVFDRLFAVLFLLILLPVIIIIVLFLEVLHGKILYLQKRSGLNGRVFTLIKFYTLHPGTHKSSWFQRVLRTSSLDELPQLVHIITGKMSFVGPRPLLPEYDALYSEEHAVRSEVKPGLTGFVQVSGRNLLSWSERLDLDVTYVRNISFITDLGILIKTLFTFVSRSGTQPSEPFRGYES